MEVEFVDLVRNASGLGQSSSRKKPMSMRLSVVVVLCEKLSERVMQSDACV